MKLVNRLQGVADGDWGDGDDDGCVVEGNLVGGEEIGACEGLIEGVAEGSAVEGNVVGWEEIGVSEGAIEGS